MNSESKKTQKTEFAYHLEHILLNYHLSVKKLASEAKLSRQNLTSLKHGNCHPSTKILKKIYDVLKKENRVPSHDLVPFIFSGIGLEEGPAFYMGQPYPIGYKPNGEKLQSRCIVTNILGECIYETILDETIRNLKKEIPYYYFLPRSSSEWNSMLIRSRLEYPEDAHLIQKRAYCIRCPEFLIYSRMRIDNIESPKPSVYMALGTSDAPALYGVDPIMSSEFVRHLKVIVGLARDARKQGQHIIPYEANGVKLEFELETNQLEQS